MSGNGNDANPKKPAEYAVTVEYRAGRTFYQCMESVVKRLTDGANV